MYQENTLTLKESFLSPVSEHSVKVFFQKAHITPPPLIPTQKKEIPPGESFRPILSQWLVTHSRKIL